MSVREQVARAIYECAFVPDPKNPQQARREIPSPGWAWDRTSDEMRTFALKQADAAIAALRLAGVRVP